MAKLHKVRTWVSGVCSYGYVLLGHLGNIVMRIETTTTATYLESVPICHEIHAVVVVVLLFYVHSKHLRSCRDGQLP